MDPAGEQTVLGANDAQSRLGWMDALVFNGRVISAPWCSHLFPRNRVLGGGDLKPDHPVIEPDHGSAAELLGRSSDADDAETQDQTETNLVVELSESVTTSGDLPSRDQVQAAQITDESVSQNSATAPLTHFDLAVTQLSSSETPADHRSLNPAIDLKKIEALREMVITKLHRVCTDMMKGASTKPSGPDPSAAALVLGQNFLCVWSGTLLPFAPLIDVDYFSSSPNCLLKLLRVSRSRVEEEISTLRRTVSVVCHMQHDWINYVLGAAYHELEEFLGWVQASYLDNLQDPGIRRLARVANLRTDAFLASLRGHEKPKIRLDQSAQPPTRASLPAKDGENMANGATAGITDNDVVAANAPMDIVAVASLIQQGNIHDAVSACTQVQGCTTTTAACNFLLKLCSKEIFGEAAATKIFNYLEQTAGDPDATTYSHFIENLCQAKNAAKAMVILQQMRARGTIPCEKDFEAVISACIGLADFSKGIQVVHQAIEAGSIPALELLNGLLSATRTTEQTTTAFQAISKAGHEPNQRSYQQLVEASCVCSDSNLTVRALRQMVKHGMMPTKALVTRAVERCATVNVRHCLKLLEMCAAESLPLPAKESVLYFLQMCGRNGSELTASVVQDCLTAMHSVGFAVDPDVKDAFRSLRVSYMYHLCWPFRRIVPLKNAKLPVLLAALSSEFGRRIASQTNSG